MKQPILPPRRNLLIPRLVAVAFVGSIAVLAFASWDVARGRVPETDAPLLLDVLNSPENRTCTRDLPELAAKHFPPGMTESAMRALVSASTVKPPRPWVWTPKVEDAIFATTPTGEISFVRTLRYTPFGNHHVNGTITVLDGKVTASKLRVVCALG
ncbi:MAG: hypothetical protein ACRCUE_12185 [Bosea sp. (in: a-proteobacteria)]